MLNRCIAVAATLVLLAACSRVPGSIEPKTAPAKAGAAGAEELPLSAYLHDLSPKLEGVTKASARLEHYSIPTRSGAVLDAWIRRPPGEAGQPLVLTITPYYGGGDPTSPANVLGEPGAAFGDFLIPYGYAVGWVSVGGTGNSGGCFRDGGAVERQQLYDAVEFFGSQTWSNGAVASVGVSYDGTTANELFVDPPAALKTVVPMEPITDYYRYSFNNGMRRELNSLFTAYYYAIVGLGPAGLNGGVGPTDPPNFVMELAGEACPEQAFIQARGAQSTASGDKTPDYWGDRDAIALVRATLDKPRPPMFWITGYQDANVDTLMADGFLEAVRDTGVPLHIWHGQWVHAYPQPTTAFCDELAPCRGDFFEVALLAWFDQWLKGIDTGILDAPMMQTQADDGVWRHENSWPGDDVEMQTFNLASGVLGSETGSGSASYTDDMGSANVDAGTQVEFISAPLEADLRLTGMPRLEALVTASDRQAGLVATLLEQFPDGSRRYVNFAAQSLNHTNGLASADVDITGKSLSFGVNFFPQDNVLYASSQLVLVIAGNVADANVPIGSNGANLLTGGPNLMPVGLGAEVSIDLAQTRLLLPVNSGNRIEPLSWLE